MNSIKLYREGVKTIESICDDLEIAKRTFSGWLKEFKEQGEQSFPGSGKIKPCNEELFQLRKKLADVTEERDILKKAVAIFSKQKQ